MIGSIRNTVDKIICLLISALAETKKMISANRNAIFLCLTPIVLEQLIFEAYSFSCFHKHETNFSAIHFAPDYLSLIM